MALGTHHTALAGDTLSMDLQVCPRTRQVYRHPGVGTQGGFDEGNWVSAGVGNQKDWWRTTGSYWNVTLTS